MRPVLRFVVMVVLPVSGTAALFLAAAAAVSTLGVDVSRPAVAVLGAVVGVCVCPPVRLRLEQHARGVGGRVSGLVCALLLSALLSLLGLAVLVPGACTAVATYAVLLVPTRRRLVENGVTALALSSGALAAQAAGVVDGVVPAGPAAVVALVLLVLLALTAPTVANVADVVRRGQRAAAELEEQRLERLRRVEHEARHDHLTGLVGRLGLAEVLERAAVGASAAAQTAVLFIDLDGFKAVNDVHGHAAGDELLVVVADRLRRCVREDDVVARTGGDEFVVVMPGLGGPEEASVTAARLREVVGRDVVLPTGVVVRVEASTGVVVTAVPRSGEELLAEADALMYAAKRSGRGGREAALRV